MPFFFQDARKKMCADLRHIRSVETAEDVTKTLVEQFRSDTTMLFNPNYSLYEAHPNGGKSLNCLVLRKSNANKMPILLLILFSQTFGYSCEKLSKTSRHCECYFPATKDAISSNIEIVKFNGLHLR